MSGRWIDHLLVLDTETTGIDTETDRIVTATAGTVIGAEVSLTSWLADPGIDIPEAATAVHGIDTARARAEGRPAAEVAAELAEVLAEHWSADVPLCAYNARFDLSIIDAELRRHHGRRLTIAGSVIDPMIIDKAVDKFRKGKRTLDITRQHYGVKLEAAHDAREDALAAARVAWKLARIYPQVGNATPEELHTLTAGWFTEQQTSFADYLSGKIAKGIKDDTERAEVLARAELIRADAKGWPVRGAA